MQGCRWLHGAAGAAVWRGCMTTGLALQRPCNTIVVQQAHTGLEVLSASARVCSVSAKVCSATAWPLKAARDS